MEQSVHNVQMDVQLVITLILATNAAQPIIKTLQPINVNNVKLVNFGMQQTTNALTAPMVVLNVVMQIHVPLVMEVISQ